MWSMSEKVRECVNLVEFCGIVRSMIVNVFCFFSTY